MTNTNTWNSVRSRRKAKIAVPFAEWLNSSTAVITRTAPLSTFAARFDATSARADAFARDLLRPLVELTVDAAREMRRIGTGRAQQKRARFNAFERYCGKIEPLFQRIEEQYPTQSMVRDSMAVTGIPTFFRHPMPSSRRDVFGSLAYAKLVAVSERLDEFFRLADEGIFAHFDRCALPSCRNYFYALRPERRYCSDGCQRKGHLQDPERKKQAAAYQRDYYRKFLSIEAVKRSKKLRPTAR